jgi:hypothetical protein
MKRDRGPLRGMPGNEIFATVVVMADRNVTCAKRTTIAGHDGRLLPTRQSDEGCEP